MSQYLTPFSIDNNTAQFQTIAVSGTSAQSTAIAARRIVITTNTLAVFVKFGANPTATTSDYLVPANSVMYFNFKTGDKVAAISSAATSISIVDQD
jgi:hypothetical protein